MRSLVRPRPRPLRPALAPTTARRHNTTQSTPTPTPTPLRSILIANRGEIALRVSRTAAHLGIRTTTLYTDPDAHAQHALASPYALNLGSTDQYLNGPRIIQLAREHGCQAIHPGYGFLSENAGFSRACDEAGVVFIGPSPEAIESMGDKARSKEIMEAAGVPCVPGYHGREQEPAHLQSEAEQMGYPVLIKAVKGGGGKGMRIVKESGDFAQQLDSAKSEARSSFGDDVMLVEKYITTPRHIEVQVFADAHGNCLALGERDCSIQRRHQKILEESPAPNLPEDIRQDLWSKARQAALAVNYRGAGTVEFIFDNDTGGFFFMEMNTRLQVEHPVTEMVTGLDLVAWQILVAEGSPLPLTQDEVEERIKARGHAIEARTYAEDPAMNFIPSTGILQHLRTPVPSKSVRIDAGFVQGDEVSPHYDPMLAKLIVSAPDRTAALQKMERALEEYEIAGVVTNIEFLKRVCASPGFVRGEVETGFIEKNRDELFAPRTVGEEVWMQAALGLWAAEDEARRSGGGRALGSGTTQQVLGWGGMARPREFRLMEMGSDPNAPAPTPTTVSVLKTGKDTYEVAVNGREPVPVTSTWHPSTNLLQTYFPHTRLDSTLIPSHASTHPNPTLTLFTHGTLHTLALAPPSWAEKALGLREVGNSVLAPMPCKILRVDVEVGQVVEKGQVLVVVESMKMETTIRAPGRGKVRRVVGVGGIVKAGVAVVEFEEEGPEEERAGT
ncbi:hypothetical protein LTR53_008837 [Teratosphaeriaceae sp. CCFEE 6253]|nr:hypothetical protein LTR53_008837 [Teratosphaeriaceae sp. CCFEE 6253]